MTPAQIVQKQSKRNATARYQLGKQVHSVDQLAALASERRSVYCDNAWGLIPAVFVMNMITSVVLREINAMRVFEYNPIRGQE